MTKTKSNAPARSYAVDEQVQQAAVQPHAREEPPVLPCAQPCESVQDTHTVAKCKQLCHPNFNVERIPGGTRKTEDGLETGIAAAILTWPRRRTWATLN